MAEESREEKLNRKWQDQLQELRVMQTGVQILTGFLLTVPFTNRFGELNDFQKSLYMATLVTAVMTTLVIIAPVCYHRLLFRQHQRPWIVAAAQLCALGGLTGIAISSIAVVLLVFDVVLNTTAAVIAASLIGLAFLGTWAVVPLLRLRDDARHGR